MFVPRSCGAAQLVTKRGHLVFEPVDLARHFGHLGQTLDWLLHEDGLLRVPVLVWGDLLVRGYTDELYERALAERPAARSTSK